ncbi:MAG: hypothetical protein PF483_14270 [Halothiobacillus sp.]|jgi:hypothetical protein|nr:hypothetical protein [Halothiobacillus sp.]
MTNHLFGGRLKPPLFIAFCFLASDPAWAATQDWAPYVRIESMTYSQPNSIKSALQEWHGAFSGGTRQWTFNTVESGVETHDWSLGVFYRKDYNLQFSRGTAEAYYLLKNKAPLPIGKHYQLDLTAASFAAKGIRATWRIVPSSRLQMRLGLSLFSASSLINGSIQGSGTALTENSYIYNAAVDYHYSRDYLFKREVNPPSGIGASLDFGFSAKIRPWLRVRGHVDDLLGGIWWKNAPYTVASASSNRESYDASGNVHFAPLISGYEGTTQHYMQRLSPRFSGQMDVGHPDKPNGIMAVQYQYGQTLLGAGASVNVHDYVFNVTAWPQVHTLSIGVAKGRYRFELGASSLSPSTTRSLWLRVNIGQLG